MTSLRQIKAQCDQKRHPITGKQQSRCNAAGPAAAWPLDVF
jgi:hypothetical protein